MRQHGAQAEFFAGPLISKIALAPFACCVEDPAPQRHAHVAADEVRRCVPARERVDQAVFLAAIVITERVSDVLNDVLVQLCDLLTDSSRF